MSDDIREVMRPTPFSPRKRVGRSADRRGDGGGRQESAPEEPAPEQSLCEEELETLSREIDAANGRLARAGKSVRLRLLQGPGAPLIEITLPDGDGAEAVRKTVTVGQLPEWVSRLESGEGLIIDETL